MPTCRSLTQLLAIALLAAVGFAAPGLAQAPAPAAGTGQPWGLPPLPAGSECLESRACLADPDALEASTTA